MTSINNDVSNIMNVYSSLSSFNKTADTTTAASTTTSSSTATSAANSKEDNTSVQRYIKSTATKDLDAKTIFSKLSIDVGSDGKTITQDQLNTYISKADSGKIKISDDEKTALKTIQSDWNTISKGSDSITYANMSGSKETLLSIAGDTTTQTSSGSVDLSESSTDKINKSLIDSALNFKTDNSSSETDKFSAMLKSLLSGTTDENDDANSEAIAKLVNLISKSTSTIEKNA